MRPVETLNALETTIGRLAGCEGIGQPSRNGTWLAVRCANRTVTFGLHGAGLALRVTAGDTRLQETPLDMDEAQACDDSTVIALLRMAAGRRDMML